MEIVEIEKIPVGHKDFTATWGQHSMWGGIRVTLDKKGKKYKAYFQCTGSLGGSLLGNCGSGTSQNQSAGLNKVVDAEGTTQYAFDAEALKKNKTNFRAIRNNLLAVFAESLVKKCGASYGAIVWGGRVNINKAAYLNAWGVCSSTLAQFLKKHKIGTITISQAFQNPNHFSRHDFSVQQFFVWTPPNATVLPAKPGVFNHKTPIAEGIQRVLKKIPEFKPQSSIFWPRADLPDPEKIGDNEDLSEVA